MEALERREVPALFCSAGGEGSAPTVRLHDGSDGSVVREMSAFDPSFTGGVRTATGDFNEDGVMDVVAGTGPGALARVRVLDGGTGEELFSEVPFEDFTGGVFVACGDVSGDGRPDLVVTPDLSGGPRVRVFSGEGFDQIADFFGIEDTAFRGGVRPAVGDVNGDRVGDLVVAAGFGGGPRIAVWDGTSAEGGEYTRKPCGDFFAFEPELRNGAYATCGDMNRDGWGDLVFGAGPGGGPRVYGVSGRELVQSTGSELVELMNLFAGDADLRGGVRVSMADVDGDGSLEVLAGDGEDGGGGMYVCDLSGEVTALPAWEGYEDGGLYVSGVPYEYGYDYYGTDADAPADDQGGGWPGGDFSWLWGTDTDEQILNDPFLRRGSPFTTYDLLR